ncbi:MAG: protein-disulfide reductase DsbD domain-containing protein [Luteolibacter sp.]|uniref:protein-disulfide reductase DsbD domain-containing protein n=1 Tax=Luteolibacter sp. TaxID=1962973 RepID=UPI0032637BB6
MRFVSFLAIVLLPSLIRAEEADKPLEIKLISEVRSVSPGKEFHLGLHLKHPPGSHTYWKNPGIVGLATKIQWSLPPGFKAGEIQWPAPRIVKMASYEAQGYEGETLLLIPILPPADLSTKTITLTAKASWMCCGKTCQPATDVPFSITLPVTESAKTDAETRPLFEKFRALVPKPNTKWTVTAQRHPTEIWLTLKPASRDMMLSDDAKKIHFFTADGQVDSNGKQGIEMIEDGTISISLPVSETGPKNPPTLPGVVSLPQGEQPAVFVEVDPKY